jgi:predicted secreted protein
MSSAGDVQGDAPRVLVVKPGVPFDIALGCAPGTGHVWHLTSLPAGVQLLGSDFSQAKDAAVGDPATQVLHLLTQRSGRFELRFELKRRWEAAPVQMKTVEIDSR